MRSEPQHEQPHNTLTRTTNPVVDGTPSQHQSAPFCVNHDQVGGYQQPMKKESAMRTENIREDASDGIFLKSSWSSVDAYSEQLAEDTDKNSVAALFDGTWRSAVSSVSTWSDGPKKTVSSQSIDSDISSTSLDAIPSLDVFDDLVDNVLYEMDTFRSDLGGVAPSYPPQLAPSDPYGTQMLFSGPFITPSTHLMDERHSHGNYGRDQLPNAHFSDSPNSFQGFNSGLFKGLKNPSRGLITVMRRLCELLSKPRSDHLDSIFVRHLNNALKKMEDAAQPQTKRPRKKAERQAAPKRQRKRPNKSALHDEASLTCLVPKRSLAVRSQSYLSAISKGADTGSETVDLTQLEVGEEEGCQRQQDKHEIKNEPFIALEDTVSDFMISLY